MRECLNCEKQFEHAAGYLSTTAELLKIPVKYLDQYCSFECFEQFESVLRAGSDASIAKGLLDTNGEPVAFEPSSTSITRSDINRTIASLIHKNTSTKET